MTQITLRELSLENWKEIMDNTYTLDSAFEDVVMFVEELLRLQKQALKDEAVRRIEEEKTDLIEKDYNANHVESRYHLINDIQDIIRNL